MTTSVTPVLELRGITKRYPGVRALSGVDLNVRPGEVHAVLGENGAGKSTLIKIMAGVQTADLGEYLVDGLPVRVKSPRDAHHLGVSVVFQELSQVNSLSVAENVFFGRLPARSLGLVDRPQLHQRTRELLATVGLAVEPHTRLGFLSMAQRQLVEIARALSQNARVIAMDEPTSALSHAEIETLFSLIDRLASQGVGIVYVSHKLDELRRLSDRTTVLRDGQHVATVDTAEVTNAELVRLMVGRKLDRMFPDRAPYAARDDASGSVPRPLEVQGLTSPMITDVSFDVRPGEVVGFSGLMGSGRTELARAIFGLDRTAAGSVRVAGRRLPPGNVSAAVRAGVGYVPEDRKAAGLVLTSSVRANLTLAVLPQLARLGSVQTGRERAVVRGAMADLRVKAAGPEQSVAALSGGNQQKVTLARWLVKEDLLVLLLDEPTRGIDVNAKTEIYRLIAAVAARGVAVIVMSSEMPELLGICDRILVLRAGRVVAHFNQSTTTQEDLMNAAIGAPS